MRTEILKFAMLMDDILNDNSHKDSIHEDGWSWCTDQYLIKKLLEEVAELIIAIDPKYKEKAIDYFNKILTKRKRTHSLKHEAVDVANLAFMLSDKHDQKEI